MLVALFYGCGPSKAELEARAKKEKFNPYKTPVQEEKEVVTEDGEIEYDDIEIRVIDSCEYIVWIETHHTAGNIIHKFNCRNPIHQNKN